MHVDQWTEAHDARCYVLLVAVVVCVVFVVVVVVVGFEDFTVGVVAVVVCVVFVVVVVVVVVGDVLLLYRQLLSIGKYV